VQSPAAGAFGELGVYGPRECNRLDGLDELDWAQVMASAKCQPDFAEGDEPDTQMARYVRM
jgi:hypothetical protein